MKKKDGLINQVDSLRGQIDACSSDESKNSLLLMLAGVLEGLRGEGKSRKERRKERRPSVSSDEEGAV